MKRFAVTAALLSACTVAPVDFSAKACPCDQGFTCRRGVCVEDTVAPEDGLVLHWPFDDDPSDRTSDDASPNGHVATCESDACPTAAIGRIDGAIALDGRGQRMGVSDDGTLATTAAFTVTAWVRPATLTLSSAVTKTRNAPAGEVSWSLGIDAAGRAIAVLDDGATATRLMSAVGMVETATWTHLALEWSAGVAHLYASGAEVATGESGLAFDSGAFSAGGDGLGPSRLPWAGALDDVRLYERALTAADVAELASP